MTIILNSCKLNRRYLDGEGTMLSEKRWQLKSLGVVLSITKPKHWEHGH